VFTVERIPELSESARKRLVNLNYTNIRFKIGDGTRGWEEHAPYDRILAAAAASRVPQPLIKQLKPGGRMVLPVGEKGLQELLLVKKMPDGSVTQEFLGEVRFVELKGDYGWSRPEKGV
jgi:protein-L-isoaspartate(D-aspartate) O-methyltransferase